MDPALPSSKPPFRVARLLPVAVLALLLGAGLVLGVLWLTRGPQPVDYLVVRGDTLGRIATAHGVTVDQLRTWNDLEGDLIQVGQVLLIHSAADASPAAAGPRPVARPVRTTSGSAVAVARTLPPVQPCLAPPDPDALMDGDEPAYLASQGLSHAQVEAAMAVAVSELYGCVPSGERPSGILGLSIEVACSGRVSAVRILDDDGLPPALVDCVTDSLRYTAFPAHDLPDGYGFHYPVSFRW